MLIIETGEIVANANSYVTVQEVVQYANLRGFHDLPKPALLSHLCVLACDYLDAQRWAGEKVQADQPLAWPRIGGGGCKKQTALIPEEIKKAQILLVLVQIHGIDLMPAHGTDTYTSKSVGSVSVGLGKTRSAPYMPQVNALIGGYLRSGLKVVRA